MRRSPRLGIKLCLGGPEPRNSALFGLPRRSMLRLGEPLRLGVTKLRLGVTKLRLGVLVSSVLVPLFR